MMIPEIPTIPTTEVQITVLGEGSQRSTKVVLLNAETRVAAQKNAGGMHLVFRYVAASRRNHGSATPPVEITFPAKDRAMDVFLPLCNGHEFVSQGIRLHSGEWVTTEIKPSIGLEPGGFMELPFDVAVEGDGSGSGRPDEPVVVFYC